MLGNVSCFWCRLLTFQNKLFLKILLGTLSECQTVWTQIRTDFLSVLIWVQTVLSVGPDLGPNCLQRLSDISRWHKERVKCRMQSFLLILFILKSKHNHNICQAHWWEMPCQIYCSLKTSCEIVKYHQNTCTHFHVLWICVSSIRQ